MLACFFFFTDALLAIVFSFVCFSAQYMSLWPNNNLPLKGSFHKSDCLSNVADLVKIACFFLFKFVLFARTTFQILFFFCPVDLSFGGISHNFIIMFLVFYSPLCFPLFFYILYVSVPNLCHHELKAIFHPAGQQSFFHIFGKKQSLLCCMK